ncbi:MAG TPA: menaquinone biosynthesis protein [Pyrinomonadaceae bacterium]|nr:menaquinone biosynthesis protein [Pyrinomonadaceae bacterium]
MQVPRISASSYSNTAPLIWSFLYGQNHGKVEIILDTAPARSAELLAHDRVDAALVPVIAYQQVEGVRLVPGVCVGAKERVRSVCLITKGEDLEQVRSVALDISSKTSVALTKIIFREFLGFEPAFKSAEPNIEAMLTDADCALLIGDPALSIADLSVPPAVAGGLPLRKFDLAETWRKYTGLGFVFAMWMSKKDRVDIDFAAARDEGLAHIDEIVSNYESEIPLSRDELKTYLSQNISYEPDESMRKGMELYFDLAQKSGLLEVNKPLEFI